MHQAYFRTQFRVESLVTKWPDAFAIITAFQTTGERWPESQNIAADSRLLAAIQNTGRWYYRVTGFSPDTGHTEPGWAVEIGFNQACALGLEFRQDAIYFVDGDTLYVSECSHERRMKTGVGPFRERLYRPEPTAGN